MTLFILADNFIQYYYGHTEAEKDGVYRPKLKYFCGYLEDCTDINIEQPMEKLMQLDTKEIFLSMDYYIEKSRKQNKKKDWVESETTIWLYLTVIKRFFKYLHNEGYTNRKIIDAFVIWENEPQQIKRLMGKVVEKNKLKAKRTIESYSEKDINKLLCEFINVFGNIKEYGDAVPHLADYTLFVSGLACILIYETGVNIGRFKILKIKDVDIDNHSINVREIVIPLSKDFISAFQFYLNIRKPLDNSEILFLDPRNSNNQVDNQFLNIFLLKINKSNVTGLIRYRIIKYINMGIPREIIMRFTAIGEILLRGCESMSYEGNFDYVNKQIKDEYEKNQKKNHSDYSEDSLLVSL